MTTLQKNINNLNTDHMLRSIFWAIIASGAIAFITILIMGFLKQPGENIMTIKQNTFAAACYDTNSIHELEIALYDADADKSDMKAWGITAAEWKRDVRLALIEKLNELDDEL